MRKRFKASLGIIGLCILGCVLLEVAYFSFQKYFNKESVIETFNDLSINYDSGKHLRIIENKSSSVSVINSGDKDVYYYIEFINLKNIKHAKYKITDGKDFNIEDDLNSYNTIVSSYIKIKPNEVQKYTFTFESDSSEFYDVEIKICEENTSENNFAETILASNKVMDGPTTQVGIETATENEGLIKTNDDNGTSYYFRGNITNNYVMINNLLFRIVKINGDGSVKLVLNDATGEIKKYYDTFTDYSFKNSSLSGYLNAFLKNNLRDYEEYIANYKYCNDYVKNEDEFYALNRIKVNNTPTHICLGEKTSSKIALLTADEVILAGATMNNENKNFYLYNENISNSYFLMTNAKNLLSGFNPFTVSANGKVMDTESGQNFRSVRPVITIIKTAKVKGDGTVDNPYVIN